MLFQELGKLKRSSIMTSIIMMAVGVLMIMCPAQYVSALVSTLTGIPARKDIAMTGEITLRGNVLPVGGIREKVMAAHRAGIRKVLLPAENEVDIQEIPEAVREEMEFVLLKTAKDALKQVLVRG